MRNGLLAGILLVNLIDTAWASGPPAPNTELKESISKYKGEPVARIRRVLGPPTKTWLTKDGELVWCYRVKIESGWSRLNLTFKNGICTESCLEVGIY